MSLRAKLHIGPAAAASVSSVFGRTGDVIALTGDYAAFYSLLGHTHAFASLTSKPTTLTGYGITDAYPLTGNPAGFLSGTIGPVIGGTGITSYATGDLLYASATNVLSKLAAGTNGYVLTLTAGVPSWALPYISAAGSTGYVQFNNAGIMSADAAFFWDNTNKRLGIGTLLPAAKIQIQDDTLTTVLNYNTGLYLVNSTPSSGGQFDDHMSPALTLEGTGWFSGTETNRMTQVVISNGTTVRGELRWYGNAGTPLMRLSQGGSITLLGGLVVGTTVTVSGAGTLSSVSNRMTINGTGGVDLQHAGTMVTKIVSTGASYHNGAMMFGSTTAAVASALIEMISVTKGFLLPRMTTTQRTAIVSPAKGLLVFDTVINKLFLFTTAWEQVTSL